MKFDWDWHSPILPPCLDGPDWETILSEIEKEKEKPDEIEGYPV